MVKRVEIITKQSPGFEPGPVRFRADFCQNLGLKVAQLVEQTSQNCLQRPIILLLSLTITKIMHHMGLEKPEFFNGIGVII